MNGPKAIALVALQAAAWCRWAGAQAEEVKVTTDTSIDCSSIEAVARNLFRDKKSDEEKAIAAWYFVRRVCFHWPQVPTWDSVDLINSYGFALCGHQSTLLCQICRAGGLRARLVRTPSHWLAEVYYGDGWHLFDCQVGWFAYKKDKSSVAGAADMKADPTIITDAVREGRASRPYFQCSGNPGAGPEWMANHTAGEAPEVPARRLILNLRRGESITRNWSDEGKGWAPPGEIKWVFPCHDNCLEQAVDANDPVNWPYWKPYARTRVEEGRTVYDVKRAFGNGRLIYAPDLSNDAFREGLAPDGRRNMASKKGVGKGPNLHAAEPGAPASLTFVVQVPYIVVDAWVEGEFACNDWQDLCRISASSDGKAWTPLWESQRGGAFKSGAISLKPVAWGRTQYLVKFEFQAREAPESVGIDSFRITSVFVNNPQALPHFMPGKNKVSVTAASWGGRPMRLRYAWEEEGRERTLEVPVERIPCTFEVEVKGTEPPRMKSLGLAIDP